MDFQVHNLFSVPVVIGHYDHAEEIKDEIIPVFKQIEKKFTNGKIDDYDDRYGFGYTSYFDIDNILDLDVCFDLKKYIVKWVNNFHTHCGFKNEVKLRSSWFTINRKYSYHTIHTHANATWSGVYYVNCENDDARIIFKNIYEFGYAPPQLQKNRKSNMHQAFTLKTGNLLIFPSYVLHEVEQQMTDNERISIAFNFTE